MATDNILLIAIICGAAVLAFAVLLWRVYNRLVRLRTNASNAWADVDVELKRRHDLVPQLVEAVRGYMTHEKELFEQVAQSRAAAAAGASDVAAQAALELQFAGVLRQLLVRVERYPELQAVANFRLLHEQLVSTENRVAFARQHYNEAVRQYNAALGTFPQNIFGRLLGFVPAAMFAGDGADRAVPAV